MAMRNNNIACCVLRKKRVACCVFRKNDFDISIYLPVYLFPCLLVYFLDNYHLGAFQMSWEKPMLRVSYSVLEVYSIP